MDSIPVSRIDFSVVSLARGAGRPQFRPHQVGAVRIFGVNQGEPIAINVRNVSDELIGVRIIVDGINMSDGSTATHDPRLPMFYIRPQGLERVDNWPKGHRSGEPLIFREDSADPVKAFELDDITAHNTICAMVFTEGDPRPAAQRTVAVAGAPLPGGGVVRRRGAASRRRSAMRLVSPRFQELVQVGFAWSTSLEAALDEQNGANGTHRSKGELIRFA